MPPLTFDYCIARVIANAPRLSRMEVFQIKQATRKLLLHELALRRSHIPRNKQILIPSVPPLHDCIHFAQTLYPDAVADPTVKAPPSVEEFVRLQTRANGGADIADLQTTTHKQARFVVNKTQAGRSRFSGGDAAMTIDTSQPLNYVILHRVSLQYECRSDILFPESEDVRKDVATLWRLLARSEAQLDKHSTSPVSGRLTSDRPRMHAVHYAMFPPEWLEPLALIRNATVVPSESNNFLGRIGLELPTRYLEAARRINDLLLSSSEDDRGAVVTLASLQEQSRYTVMGDDFDGEVISLPNSYGARYSTRKVMGLSDAALRDLFSLLELVHETLRLVTTKTGAGYKGGAAATHLRSAGADYMRAVEGLEACLTAESFRRLYLRTEPVKAVELVKLAQISLRGSQSGVQIPRRTGHWSSGAPLNSAVIKAFERRSFSPEVFQQGNYFYLHHLLDRVVDAPSGEKLQLFRRHIKLPLTLAVGTYWSFYNNNQMQCHLHPSMLSTHFLRTVVDGAMATGWLHPSHLLLHSSWNVPISGVRTPIAFVFWRRCIAQKASECPPWTTALSMAASKPDSSYPWKCLRAYGEVHLDPNQPWFIHSGVPIADPTVFTADCGKRLEDFSERVALGGALFYLCFFSSAIRLDPVLITLCYEAHKSTLAQHPAMHALFLATLIRSGPVTAEVAACIESMLPTLEDDITKALDTMPKISNTYSEAYGLLALYMIAHPTKEWYMANAWEVVGADPQPLDTTSQIARSAIIQWNRLGLGGDLYVILRIAIFFQALDKWHHRRHDVMAEWAANYFRKPLKTIREATSGTEMNGNIITLLSPNATAKLAPAVYATPHDLSHLHMRMHRMLCLHDTDSLVVRRQVRPHWDVMFHGYRPIAGEFRAVGALSVFTNKVHRKHQGSAPVERLNMTVNPLGMRPVWVTELAQCRDNDKIAVAIGSWWVAHRCEALSRRTLFDMNEYVGGDRFRVGAVVSLADRMLRVPELREQLLVSGHGSGVDGAPADSAGRYSASDIASQIAGDEDPAAGGGANMFDNSSEVADGDFAADADNGEASTTADKTASAVADQVFSDFDPLTAVGLRVPLRQFLWVAYTDIISTLMNPKKLMCVIGADGSNCLLNQWPRLPATGSDTSGTARTSFFLTRNPAGYTVEDGPYTAEEGIAAATCAYEISLVVGAPPWLSTRRLWAAVALRLMAPSCLWERLTNPPGDNTASHPATDIVASYGKQFDRVHLKRVAERFDASPVGVAVRDGTFPLPAVAQTKGTGNDVVPALAALHLTPAEQVELLGCVAAAMLSSACHAISRSAAKAFRSHARELCDALVYTVGAGADSLLSTRGEATANHLAPIITAAMAMEVHVHAPSVLIVAQRIGLGLAAAGPLLVAELRNKIGLPASHANPKPTALAESTTQQEEGAVDAKTTETPLDTATNATVVTNGVVEAPPTAAASATTSAPVVSKADDLHEQPANASLDDTIE